MGGVHIRVIEMGKGDVEGIAIGDKCDDCHGYGHQQTEEEGQSPPDLFEDDGEHGFKLHTFNNNMSIS